MDMTVIGPAIIDILAKPASARVFETGSEPADEIKLSYGGDACNESIVLSRLGKSVSLLTVLGTDEAGKMVHAYLARNHVDTCLIQYHPEIPTGMNLVLVDQAGERCFITNPHSSLRRLSADMILGQIDSLADIVSFASIFVSHDLSIPALTDVFRAIKQKPGRILTADFTRPKNGETLADLTDLLPCLDVVFANEIEASMLTGAHTPSESAQQFVRAGVGCAVVKTGKHGCTLCHGSPKTVISIPAYSHAVCVDTTGAGDCFAAGFLYALSEHLSYEDCARFGSATASFSIETVGATDGVQSLDAVQERFQLMKSY